MLDASLVHDVVPADALRGLGRSSALIMRTGLPALGQDRAFLHRKVRTQRTLTQASGRRCLSCSLCPRRLLRFEFLSVRSIRLVSKRDLERASAPLVWRLPLDPWQRRGPGVDPPLRLHR